MFDILKTCLQYNLAEQLLIINRTYNAKGEIKEKLTDNCYLKVCIIITNHINKWVNKTHDHLSMQKKYLTKSNTLLWQKTFNNAHSGPQHCSLCLFLVISQIHKFTHFLLFSTDSPCTIDVTTFWSNLMYRSADFLFLFLDVLYCWLILSSSPTAL